MMQALLRRGSARKALGKTAEAEEDLHRCCQLQVGQAKRTEKHGT